MSPDAEDTGHGDGRDGWGSVPGSSLADRWAEARTLERTLLEFEHCSAACESHYRDIAILEPDPMLARIWVLFARLEYLRRAILRHDLYRRLPELLQ